MRLCLLLQVLLIIISPPAAAAQGQHSSRAGEAAYQKAADQSHRLMQDSSAGQSRKEWLKAVAALEQVYQQYPKSHTAPACLHLAARLRISMHQRFRQPADQDQAIALFHNIVTLFPQSSEAADALYAIAEIAQINGNLRDAAKTYYKLTKNYPFSPRKAQAEEKLKQLTAIAKSLAARKDGRRPPSAVTAAPRQPVKPAPAASAEPEWELIYTEPEPAPSSSRSTFSEKKAAQAPAASVKPAPKLPQTASQWRNWKPAVPAPSKPADKASTSVSVRREKNISPPAPVLREQKTVSAASAKSADPPPTASQGQIWKPAAPAPSKHAASAPSKPTAQPAVPTINFSELKIAEPDFAVSAKQENKVPLTPAVVSEQQKPATASAPKVAVKVEATPAQPEEEKKPFWKRILPDFMFGSDEKGEKQAAVQSAESEPVTVPPAVVSEKKAELPSVQSAQNKEPEQVTAAKPDNAASDAEKIVVAPLQIAAMEPPPDEQSKETQPSAAPASSFQPEKTAAAQEEPLPDLLLIQHWSSDRYSRVAVNASGPTEYHVELPDRSSSQPGMLHIDFERISASPAALTPMVLKNGLVKSIYTKLSGKDAVRVSLELAAAADCKVFSLNDPFRVVIDIRSLAEPEPEKPVVAVAAATAEVEKHPEKPEEKTHEEPVLKTQSKVKPVEAEKLTLAQQLGLGIRRIVIDPGHGGKDTGAVAFGLKEKDIVLKVAKRIRKILKKEGYEIFLTREKDVFLPLEERTAIANTKGADLFLSIHVNAHPKSWVRGVETFYLNLAANPEAMRVAALENATSTRSMSEMEGILTDLMKNTKINESSQLAEFIQTSMAEGLRSYKIRSLGVKKAPFYVLIGAQMPAALAEISFITNEKEAALLKDDKYLQTIVEHIAAGVTAYAEHRRTAATAALHLSADDEKM